MIAAKEGGVSGYLCRRCGIFSKGKTEGSTVIGEKIKQESEDVKVVKEEDNYVQYPKTNIECPECGHNEAYWYMQQTRGADEPQTKFYSCVKCGNKWRDYD